MTQWTILVLGDHFHCSQNSSWNNLLLEVKDSSCRLLSSTSSSCGLIDNNTKRAASTTAAGHAQRHAGQQEEEGGTVPTRRTLYTWGDTANGASDNMPTEFSTPSRWRGACPPLYLRTITTTTTANHTHPHEKATGQHLAATGTMKKTYARTVNPHLRGRGTIWYSLSEWLFLLKFLCTKIVNQIIFLVLSIAFIHMFLNLWNTNAFISF